MARLKGENALKNRDLIAYIRDDRVYTRQNGSKAHYIDVQLNADALDKNDLQSDLHLHTQKKTVDGKVLYNNSVQYQESQLDAMMKAAGDNVYEMPDKNARLVAFKGDLFIKDNKVLVNTTTLGPSEFKVDENTFNKQLDKIKESKAIEMESAPSLEAPSKSAEKESKVLESSEPQF